MRVTTLDEKRIQLIEAVARLAAAIDAGECVPTLEELQALAKVCDTLHLPALAARVRRWLRP